MPAKIFKFGDVLKEIPGITRRDLYYWISEGFIKPIAVKKKKVNRLEFRENELEKIKKMGRHCRLGVFPRLAYERTLIDLEVERMRGDKPGIDPLEQAIDRLKELILEYPNCRDYIEEQEEEIEDALKENAQLQEKRAAIHVRLQEEWNQVKGLPPCLKQAQVFKETAQSSIGAVIISDPLAEEDSPLSKEQVKEYAGRALEIAEQVGDLAEAADICLTLAVIHSTLFADCETALECCDKAFALGEKIGNLYLLRRHCLAKYEILTLTESDPEELIQYQRQEIDIIQRQGDINAFFPAKSRLAKQLILSGDIEAGAEELEKSRQLAETMPYKTATDVSYLAHFYYGTQSLLEFRRGDTQAAIESQKKAVQLNAENRECREHLLVLDLAWLESLYQQSGREDEFRGFCHSLVSDELSLEQWHLEKEAPGPVEWNKKYKFKGKPLPKRWNWEDPLQRSSYKLSNGIEISPIWATGFTNNVYVPRLMQEAEGDFAIEAVLDYSDGFAKAGGILAYQDDDTLIRLGAGIQYDGEITLTIKSPARGFSIIARGLLEAESLHLRLERDRDRFRVWCGNGREWFSSGQVSLPMGKRMDIGIFAECAYRHHSLVRCTNAPLKFKEVKVKRG